MGKNKALVSGAMLLIALNAAASQNDSRSRGFVRIPDGVTAVIVNNKQESITLHGGDGSIDLPVGTYRIDSWQIDRLDREGTAWKAKGTNFVNKGIFEVASGQEYLLPVGEPIVSALSVKKQDSAYSLSHSLSGRLSERVEITQNGSRPPAPKLQITNKDGSYREHFDFAYG